MYFVKEKDKDKGKSNDKDKTTKTKTIFKAGTGALILSFLPTSTKHFCTKCQNVKDNDNDNDNEGNKDKDKD